MSVRWLERLGPWLVAGTMILLGMSMAKNARAAPSAHVGSARGSALVHGLNEMFVAVDNDADQELRGRFYVESGQMEVVASADVVVAPHETARVHLPVNVDYTTKMRFVAESGQILADETRGSEAWSGAWTFDLTADAALRAMDRSYPGVRVATPDKDGKQPVVPRHAGSYAPFALVVAPIDRIAAFTPTELEAITTFVLGGGTLAVYARRPEDLRAPIVEAFAAGIVAAGKPSAELLAPSKSGVPAPSDVTTLSGAYGGNLEQNAFGAEAPYGLGRFVVLGFDAELVRRYNWVTERLLELAQDSARRQAVALFPPGDLGTYLGRPVGDVMRDLLLEKGAARVAMIVATLLLVAFAILAGPINFRLAWKKNRPGRAIWILVAASVATFFLVVGIGVMMRGTEGSSRRTIFADVGAGMSRGVAWRIRGYYSGEPLKMRVTPTRETSSLVWWRDYGHYERMPSHGLGKDGAYLDDVDLQPWRLVFVRDDALIDVGGGLSIVGSDEPVPRAITLVNRTGFELTSVLVRLPDGSVVTTPKIAPGESMSTDTMTRDASTETYALRGASVASRAASTASISLNAELLGKILPPDVAHHWAAADEVAHGQWFPVGVPVVLAELGLPIERETDGGFDVTRQRTFVRVVGFGGAP